MNLLDEDFETKKKDNTKVITRIIVVLIVVIILIIIGIASYMAYIESTELRLSLDGQVNQEVLDLLVFESDGTIYVPIRAISSYLGYRSYNGSYENRSEDTSRCYIECEGEIVDFTVNSDKIYKLSLSGNGEDYTYIYMDKPVKAIDGQLYITTDGMQKAFNVSFDYNGTNSITMYTMSYLINGYTNTVLNYGYTGLSENFENNKAVLKNMLVVTDGTYYGVISSVDGTEILECKYNDIVYQELTEDFIVQSNNQYGIIGTDKRTKVDIIYDNITLMDYDAGLYLVQRNNHYGVIDLNGNNKIYVEYDQIGVDISQFPENDLKTGYLLVGNLIPVKRDNKWGLFDKNGNQLVDFEYDSFGYTKSSTREANNLLVIPDFNIIVGCVDERYTLLNSTGNQVFNALVDEIYMTISGGEKHYVMVEDGSTYDVEEFLEDRLGIEPLTSDNTSSNATTDTNTVNNTETNTEDNTTQEDNEENNQDNQDNNEEE